MEQLTTYRAKGKDVGLEFLFKYDLNGNLKAFELAEGILEPRQMKWLFSPNFPANESIIKTIWMKDKDYKKKFDVTVSPAVLTFDAVWELFDHKIKKFECETQWNKSNEATKIKVFTSIPAYKKYVDRKGIAQKNLASYILKRYYEDDWNKAN
jgi:hypothetical protein